MALYGDKRIKCSNCNTLLKVHKVRMLPFYLFFNTVAILFGMTMIYTRDYLKWIMVLIVWIFVMMALYPLLLLSLKNNGEGFEK